MTEPDIVCTDEGFLVAAPPSDAICPICFEKSRQVVAVCGSVTAYCEHHQTGASLQLLVPGARWKIYRGMTRESFDRGVARGVDDALHMRVLAQKGSGAVN